MNHPSRARMPRASRAAALCASAAIAVSAALTLTTAASAQAADAGAGQSYNGLALTPPMGWNSWYQYRCGVTQAEVLANAQALVSSGLAKLGYDYVNLDDCWMAPQRAADGQLQGDPTTFPNGIAWLASQLHAMGLKLGLYESFGNTTCQRRPGSYGHYQQDAQTFADWGVDFLKFDYCGLPAGTTSASLESDYQQMSNALLATGHDIVFSEELPVGAGDANPANANYLPYVSLSSRISNMWRMAPDESTNYYSTVFGHLADDLPLASYAHPGAWNDMDMLLTGTSGYNWTPQQQQTQMSIWAEMASPLLSSTDLTNMSATTAQILGNRAVIAVDQDPLGKQGQLVTKDGSVDVVSKPLANGDVAVLLANSGSTPQQATTEAASVGLPGGLGGYSVSDLWAGTTRETAANITEWVPAQSAILLRVAPIAGPGVAQDAPLTAVSLSAQMPPTSPGSQFTVAVPGETFSVPASLTNEGRASAVDASLAVSAPSGWQVSGSPATSAALPTGQQISGSWQVTVPSGTAAGSYTLTATASYSWASGQTTSNSAQTTIQVVVPPTGSPTLDQLTWLSATNGYGPVGINKNYYGGPLSIHGTTYAHGLWVNSPATLYYYLGGDCSTFTADLGLDDSDRGAGSVIYEFYADGKQIYNSGVVTNSTPTLHADVDVSGAQVLELQVAEGNGTPNYGNADFGTPQLTCQS
ncbi:MAG TPA: NPCBM/NEW2 domain-containing protein [Solirubrobacteraceae bacterium]|nr:NPCBM/NEW2 domain-containing protein [Solirubrobacteraceae bacterium]